MDWMELFIRLSILAAVAATTWLAVRWWRARLRTRAAELRDHNVKEIFPDLDIPQAPTVLAFATPNCVECRARQVPALEELRAKFNGGVHIRKLNAIEHPEVAQHFSILTVPSTVVLDPHGQVRHINHGLAESDKLEQQVAPLL